MTSLSERARRFLEANAQQPLAYYGLEPCGQLATLRLADGRAWRLNRDDLLAIGQPRWGWQ